MSKTYQKKLDPIAERVANLVAFQIHNEVKYVKTPDMPYKAQYVLEEVVKLLKEQI